MAKKFSELRAQMSPERRAANEAATKHMLLEMNLQELRTQMSDLSQGDVAKLLEVTQGYISRIERTKDISVRRLYEYVQTVGGQLELRAKFPDKQEVVISQFEDVNVFMSHVLPFGSEPADVFTASPRVLRTKLASETPDQSPVKSA